VIQCRAIDLCPVSCIVWVLVEDQEEP
jgi:hypothetical protein